MSQPAPSPKVSPAELHRIASLFKVLGEPTRLRILQSVCESPLHVSEIVASSESTQTNVSKHLRLLVHEGVLYRKRDGQRVFYGLQDPLVLQLCELVKTARNIA